MTPLQYIFHYLEICNHQKKDIELEIRKLKAGSSEIKKALKYLMIVVNQERGSKAVEIIEEEDREIYEREFEGNKDSNNTTNNDSDNNTGKPLKKEDQELWDFMMSTPETMTLPEQARMTRDYVVEAKSLADVAEDLGLIGLNDEVRNDDTSKENNINNIDNADISDKSTKKPMVIKSIDSTDEEVELGFEIY